MLGFLTFRERFEMPSSYLWALGAAYFMFVTNLITRTKEHYRNWRRLNCASELVKKAL